MSSVERLLASRRPLVKGVPLVRRAAEAEGGCGVIGMASDLQLPGRHLLQALFQMRNRGNGKGGGIAAAGLVPEQLGVSREVLDRDYLVTVAFLDERVRSQVESRFWEPVYQVDHVREVPRFQRYARAVPPVPPPRAVQYFVRPTEEAAARFREEYDPQGRLSRQAVEDELVYQTSYRLNRDLYFACGETRAFVMSHGKDLTVLKMVGYGDDVVRCYELEEMRAHIWIGHHRYPTRGRVWHPGGAHPFAGLHEVLVHNGDFANYAGMVEYLAQANIRPLFLTDTEVSVQLFDLLHRIYGYPLEYVIECMAPTTERDFHLLPAERRRLYRMLQQVHLRGSPDGPWFFLIARTDPGPEGPAGYRLIGITDTSMLRPQVFALQQVGEEGPGVGFAASEKQAIDAALRSLAAEDSRFWPRPDRVWNARGGSHTDGGAFVFTVRRGGPLECTDKFGRLICLEETGSVPRSGPRPPVRPGDLVLEGSGEEVFRRVAEALRGWSEEDLQVFLDRVVEGARTRDAGRDLALSLLTRLLDRRYSTGRLRRSRVLAFVDRALSVVVECFRTHPTEGYVFHELGMPLPRAAEGRTVFLDAHLYPPEGPDSAAREVVRLVEAGFRRLAVVHCLGHRFLGNGLGPGSEGVRLDVYGSPGDYLASGVDGAMVEVHGSAQDQVAQIMRAGQLIIHGDVGQTFMYGAKGGTAYVLGNAAGRPLINAVGTVRVVINGTCLDYLAESFMAGDPHDGGGFVVLNGLGFGVHGDIVDLPEPYPGSNLFSLASGGAIYLRDPRRRLTEDQLNGGEFAPFTSRDWELIRPYLEENERLFNVPVRRLLEVDGTVRAPEEVYRVVRPGKVKALQAEEAWVKRKM